ncbi:hypothetical protein AR273_17595 [Stenotrophomonas maltophilia]|nr:hypothetical protein AR273_17595 [Stenotrophomonas maltophilia]
MSSDVHRTISVFLSLLDCLLGQYEGIINLCVDSGADHRCVDAAIKYGLAIKLGARWAMMISLVLMFRYTTP